MALPQFPPGFAQVAPVGVPELAGVAPSNRITEYSVNITTSSDLSKINFRVIITRCSIDGPPVVFEMLLTQEQYAVFCQMFNPF